MCAVGRVDRRMTRLNCHSERVHHSQVTICRRRAAGVCGSSDIGSGCELVHEGTFVVVATRCGHITPGFSYLTAVRAGCMIRFFLDELILKPRFHKPEF